MLYCFSIFTPLGIYMLCDTTLWFHCFLSVQQELHQWWPLVTPLTFATLSDAGIIKHEGYNLRACHLWNGLIKLEPGVSLKTWYNIVSAKLFLDTSADFMTNIADAFHNFIHNQTFWQPHQMGHRQHPKLKTDMDGCSFPVVGLYYKNNCMDELPFHIDNLNMIHTAMADAIILVVCFIFFLPMSN